MEKRSVMEGRRRPEKRIFAGTNPVTSTGGVKSNERATPCPPRRHDLKRKEDSEGCLASPEIRPSVIGNRLGLNRKSPLTLGVEEDDHCCGF
ncbi:unnamed protein product [Camellia sinensis]